MQLNRINLKYKNKKNYNTIQNWKEIQNVAIKVAFCQQWGRRERDLESFIN